MASKTSVLLIDDDAFVSNFLATMIQEAQLSLELVSCSSYPEGLEKLRSNAFDACLLDFHLGDRSGLELLQEATRRGVSTPIVMLTGESKEGTDYEALRLGAADYIQKGTFNAEMLERVVRYAIERAKTSEALRISQQRFLLAVEGANDGLWDWKVSEDDIFLSARWKNILGFQDSELPNKTASWFSRIHDADQARMQADLAFHLSGKSEFLETEHRLLHHDGTYRWVLVRGKAIRGQDGKADRIAGSLTDVTPTRAKDPLTGLPNRTLYLDRLERALARSRRDETFTFAVLFLDIDRFKVVNDSLGHSAGDSLLQQVASRLQGAVREVDTVARLGGDEFTFILQDAREPDGATRVAERILELMRDPFLVEGREVYVGGSIGIAFPKSTRQTAEEILRDADTAMYRAKQQGKNRYVVFDDEMHERALRLLRLENDFRRTLELDGFEPYYQPIVNLKTKAIVGFEVLVRWNHPEQGFIPPDQFIPIAEETGAVVALDRSTLRKACRQMRLWFDRFPSLDPLMLSVNVSQPEFETRDSADFILAALKNSGCPATSLTLELTERALVSASPMVSVNMSRLRAAGVRLTMDDFGTGYSSLAYLHKLPLSGLKIDRAFVAHLDEKQSFELTRLIVTLGKTLNLKVVAEGVETEIQQQTLIDMGCEWGQGYYFARPSNSELVTRLLEDESKKR